MLKRTMFSVLLTSIITAIIFGVITFSYVDNYKTTYAYVSLDINPSIAFELNKKNDVVMVKALNDDADVLDLERMKGLSFVAATEQFVQQANEHGFIDNDASMCITAVDLKEDASFERLKNTVFTADNFENSLDYLDISFAESTLAQYKRAQMEHVSLKSYVEESAYLDIDSSNATSYAFSGTVRHLVAVKNSDDLTEDTVIIDQINEFLTLIKDKQSDSSLINSDFVSSIRLKMAEPNADYHAIYKEVIVYWESLNDAIHKNNFVVNQIETEVLPMDSETQVESSESQLQEQMTKAVIEEDTVEDALTTTTAQYKATTTAQYKATTTAQYKATTTAQYKATTTAQYKATTTAQYKATTTAQYNETTTAQHETVTEVSTPVATGHDDDLNAYDTEDVSDLTRAKAVEEFFNQGSSDAENIRDEATHDLNVHPEVKNKISELNKATTETNVQDDN